MTSLGRLPLALATGTILGASLLHGDTNLQTVLERKVVLTENKTIFTLFCLLNLGGYDEENNPAGMHATRIQVRQQLAREAPPEVARRIRSFYQAHKNADPYNYSVVAMLTSGPPDFKFTAQWPDVSKDPSFGSLEGLPPLLRDLYATAPIEKIYAGVRPDYRRYIDLYRAAIVAQVSKVLTYCRVSTLADISGGEVQHAAIIPNLLDSFDHAFSFVLSDTFDSVEGPQEKIGYNPHEFVHSITNPISYDATYKTLQEHAGPLYDVARTIPGIGDVDSLQNFLDENLVRAISLKYLDDATPARSAKLREVMMQEYRSGYILERFFYEQLGEYEKSGQGLSAYYPTMLKRLDAKYELASWKQETKTLPK